MADLKIDKNKYTVDSVYQWDINQELKIYGLSMLDPEIHFTSEAMGGSIVVECTVDASGVISVNIPNSLLQYKYPIVVYVAGFEGDTYKTYHKFSIPVKARKKPGDYTLSLSDDEVYSFNSMERRIINIESEIESEGSILYSYDYDADNVNLVEASGEKTIGEYIPLVSESLKAVKGLSDKFKTMIDDSTHTSETALSIAKGINSARVFETTVDMEAWLSDEANKGKCNVGNNLYIIELNVPDWWIAEVLDEPDSETGFYYKIAQLETQKVDLDPIHDNIDTLQEDVKTLNNTFDNNVIPRVETLEERPNYSYCLAKETLNGRYEQLNDLSTDFYSGSVVEYRNELHKLGGYLSKTIHEKWDGEKWITVSTLPYEFHGACAVVFNDEIHILGGSVDGAYSNHYKWDGSTWTSVSSIPDKFYGGCAVVYKGMIHLLGNASDTNISLNHYKWNGTSWTKTNTMPYQFYNGLATVYNNEIHIFGGGNSSVTVHNKKHYKFNGSTWTNVDTMTYPYYYGTAVTHKGKVYLIGNADAQYKNLITMWNGSTWTYTQPPYECCNGGALVYNNEIHIVGGWQTNLTKKFYKFKLGTYVTGYMKNKSNLYLPIASVPLTTNLEAIEDGYKVTKDGYVEVSLIE